MALAASAVPAAIVIYLGWLGDDWPAQVFRADLVRNYGLVLWNSQWYGGHPTFSYSVLGPALGALIGPAAVAAASGIVAALAFDRLVHRSFGPAWWVGSLWFALATTTNLIIGRATFALGGAFALAALWAFQEHHIVLAGFAAAAAGLSSPAAGLFVVVGGLAWALSGADRRVAGLVLAAAAGGPMAVIAVAFPDAGVFPYEGWAFVLDLLVCALVAAVMWGRHAVLCWGAAVLAAVCVVAYLVPSAGGANVSRLGMFVAGPLLACALWPRHKAVLVALVVPLLSWTWYPSIDAVMFDRRDASTTAGYYTPLVSRLSAEPAAQGRLEIPFTHHHWETAYVADKIPLARGWERDLDEAHNRLFYDGTLSAETYRAWLEDNAVEFVALPDAKLDSSSEDERALLLGGLPYLQALWHNDHWTLWRFEGYRGLVDGPASLLVLDPTGFTLDVHGLGPVLVRVRASGHWYVEGEGDGCATTDASGWTLLENLALGRVKVSQSLFGTPCT